MEYTYAREIQQRTLRQALTFSVGEANMGATASVNGGLAEIKIQLEGIGHALSDGKLFVPRNQRSYAWGQQHVSDLFRDIATAITRKENEYFLGSIVVSQRPAGHLEVVDGQQRLATTSILLAAVRDYFFGRGDGLRAEQIERDFLMTRDLRTQELIPKLHLNAADHDFYLGRILSLPNSAARSTSATLDSHKCIALAASLAAEHVERVVGLSNTPTEVLVDWVEYLQSRVRVIWVRVPDHANAFTIFETLNDRGLDLAISDLLKNYLFHLAGDRLLEVEQRWMTMLATLEAVAEEAVVVPYIRHFWASKYGLTRERDLYAEIRKRIDSRQRGIDFATDLADGARLYAGVLNTDSELWCRYGTTARGHMATLNTMGMVQIRPLLLAIFQRFPDEEVRRTLRLLVSWAVRFLIVGGVGGGTLEKQYSERAKEVTEGRIQTARGLFDVMQGIVPVDGQFESAFSVATVSRSPLARYYLQALERQAQGAADPELVPNPNEEQVNLEHVLPRSPSAAWSYIDPELAKVLCRRLGNMALLRVRANVAAGDDGFSQKKRVYAESDFQLTHSIGGYNSWGPAEIEDRQRSLARLAVGTWPNRV
jgi:Protein of unknown function DUF262/Protein of unknown function (DUF1524)